MVLSVPELVYLLLPRKKRRGRAYYIGLKTASDTEVYSTKLPVQNGVCWCEPIMNQRLLSIEIVLNKFLRNFHWQSSKCLNFVVYKGKVLLIFELARNILFS